MIIVGSGESLENYRVTYSHPRIEFRGSVYGDDLIKIYHEASSFVFPSTDESWGLVLNEAMSAGLPGIVHNEVGAVYDLVLDKETGFIIKDWDDLEDSMLRLYNDKELCERLAANSVNLMRDHWNYSLYERSLLSFIRALT